ncbi:MAG: hypothetical protein ACE144_18910 [Thermodesulfobacteriota bacterium]
MGILQILNGNEEEKYSWDPCSPAETRIAREKFEDCLKQGFVACKIVRRGEPGAQITQFDPEAEEIFVLGLADGG